MNYKYPQESTLIPLDEIVVGDRIRDDYGDIQELADSIQEHGLLSPPILTKAGNKLIAGGRRLKALSMLGDTIPVVYREEMEDHTLMELELEENVKRLNMTWQEEVLSMYYTHKAKVKANIKLNKEWKQKETGKLLGISAGHVSLCLHVANLLVAGDEEIKIQESLQKAWGVVLKRREQQAMQKIAEKSGLKTVAPNEPFTVDLDTDTPTQTSQTFHGSLNSIPDNQISAPTAQPVLTTHEINLGDMFFLGDCLEVMKAMPEKHFDHIVTDIPYGIDMDNLDTLKNLDRVESEHDVEQNVGMMKPFLENAYRLVKDSGYVVFWYDLDHHEKLLAWAREIGFQAQSWPLVWVKTHTCRNNAANKNFTKATEVAMVLRKSAKTTMVDASSKNFIIADGSAERKLYDNPFAKPFEVWKFILKHIAFKGQTILDPFAGQMSMPRACINMGINPVGIELNPHHFFHGVKMIEELYREMTQDSITFHNNPTEGMSFDTPEEAAKKAVEAIDKQDEENPLPF